MEGREEMEPGIDIEEQPESPLLIAMKGHSSSNKSRIAHELAQFLNFPLIDEEDIIGALQGSLETEHFDDLSFGNSLANLFNPALFEAQCYHQRSALSPRPFDRLVELASFTGARLVFVECSNQNDQDLDYYDVGNVPKLNIDTTKPFHAEDFITGMLKAAALI